ncbi:DUF3107 domain-containing protein [Raineyella sp. LH-20]|uniref:DUF3107 domain-containing protein n=1 Tax=Raineyella sp. LH-20 TaxID=3081204 RepID=UPI0029553B0C|nr:DUF3107 domain-containing protein [Raineyella sp. LH-20]WOP17878.1 DUF3107 domain-containing protein [Raineyella sp. LH-20]
MEIKIGVKNLAREVVVDLDQTVDAFRATYEKALADGTLLSLTDTHGRQVLIPADAVAYVEIGQPNARPVGFGSL